MVGHRIAALQVTVATDSGGQNDRNERHNGLRVAAKGQRHVFPHKSLQVLLPTQRAHFWYYADVHPYGQPLPKYATFPSLSLQ